VANIAGNRSIYGALGVVALAAIVAASFYIGRHNAEQKMPSAAGRSSLDEKLTRLPLRKFGNWTLACAVDSYQQKRCNLVFLAVDSTRKHLLMRMAVTRTKKGGSVIAVSTPPSALISAGVKLMPGSAQPITVPFVRCLPRACQADIAMTDSISAALAAADTTLVSFVAGTGRPVSYKLATEGFKAGYAAWLGENPVPQAQGIDSAPATISADK
jgi:invasion protein IalB